MKKIMLCRKKVLILVAAIVLLVIGIYGMTRPIFYGASYYHASFYDGNDFNGTMKFYTDNTVVIRNTNFDEEIKSFYYYKNGYVFFCSAQTEEEYKAEVAVIDADFEKAVNSPFYASKINVFKLTSEGPDGYKSIYLCQNSMMMAVVCGAIELTLVGFYIASAAHCKKDKCKE